MLDWAADPDQVFHEMVAAALEVSHGWLSERHPARCEKASAGRAMRRERQAWLRDTMPRSAKLFTPDEMLPLLARLVEATGIRRPGTTARTITGSSSMRCSTSSPTARTTWRAPE